MFPRIALLLLFASTPWAVAEDCNTPSPTVTDGVPLWEAINPNTLSREERKLAQSLLRRFKGRYEGTGTSETCMGTQEFPDKRYRELTLKGEGKGGRRSAELNLDIEQDNGERGDRFQLVIRGNELLFGHRGKAQEVELVSLTENALMLALRYHRKTAAGGATPFEVRYQFSFSGNDLLVDQWFYTLVGLIGEEHWTLHRTVR